MNLFSDWALIETQGSIFYIKPCRVGAKTCARGKFDGTRFSKRGARGFEDFGGKLWTPDNAFFSDNIDSHEKKKKTLKFKGIKPHTKSFSFFKWK